MIYRRNENSEEEKLKIDKIENCILKIDKIENCILKIEYLLNRFRLRLRLQTSLSKLRPDKTTRQAVPSFL